DLADRGADHALEPGDHRGDGAGGLIGGHEHQRRHGGRVIRVGLNSSRAATSPEDLRRRSARSSPMQGLDPRVIAAWRLKAKRQLRQRMRGLRAALPKSAHAARSQAICERVASLAEFQRAERVALFWPMVNKHETDLRPLDAVARQANKAIAYPYLERDGTLIHTGF